MENSKEVSTPITVGTKLSMNKEGNIVDHNEYKKLIRSLLYLIASRPDIIFTITFCARFQSDLKVSSCND
jgi:hypothetical protein